MDVAVNRCLAYDGEPLYVGYSRWNWVRFDGHADKEWFSQVEDVKIEHWPSVETAKVREMQLIVALCPTHNRDLGLDPGRGRAILDRLAEREWDEEDATADWFVDAWRDGSVNPWAFSYRVIRPLGAALADGMFGDYDALPEWYGRHLEMSASPQLL